MIETYPFLETSEYYENSKAYTKTPSDYNPRDVASLVTSADQQSNYQTLRLFVEFPNLHKPKNIHDIVSLKVLQPNPYEDEYIRLRFDDDGQWSSANQLHRVEFFVNDEFVELEGGYLIDVNQAELIDFDNYRAEAESYIESSKKGIHFLSPMICSDEAIRPHAQYNPLNLRRS